MQRPIFNTILEVRVIDMVDHCGQGLFHHIAWQNCPIQIITVGVPGYLGIWEYLLDIPGTPSPYQQFSRATILAYDGQVAVVRHYPHLISPISVKYGDVSLFVAGEITANRPPVQHCGNHTFRKGDLPAALDRASMAMPELTRRRSLDHVWVGCVYRKLKPERSGDEVRPRGRVN